MSKISQNFDSINNQGLILQLFELGKLFVDKKTVVFRAQGACMHPCIRQGDVLHLETKNLKEIVVGDIVVYRRGNRLFSHRAIDKVNHAGAEYLLTRPDSASFGNDEPVADKDILGIIAKIERKGKLIGPERKTYPPLRRCLYHLDYKWWYFKQRIFVKMVDSICFLQGFKFYCIIAKILFFLYYKKLNFSLQVPLNDLADCRFYRVITSRDFSAIKTEIKNGRISQVKIVAAINKSNIACLDLIFKSSDGFSLGFRTSAVSTKIRYRHSGIEEKLSNYTGNLLKQIYRAS